MTSIRNLLVALALLWAVPADAASRFWVPAPVSGAISGTAGVCRLTVPGTNGYVTGNSVTVTSVTGATGCNVTTTVTVVDGTHIELDGSTFGGVYVSGGLVSGGNWTATNTANWAATTGSTTVNQSVPGTGDAANMDASSCAGASTIAILIDIAVQSWTWGTYTNSCTIDNSANHNVTTTGTAGNWFSGTGTGTRTFIGGTGTYTESGNFAGGSPWNMGVVTNLSNPTTAFSSATFVMSGTGTLGGTFIGGSLTYGTVTLTGHASIGGYNISGSNNITTLNITAPNSVGFTNGTTNTITNAFSWSGTSTNRIMITSSTPLATATLAIGSGTATLDWGILRNITTSGGTARNATNTLDMGGNTWSSITAPPASSGGKIICGSLQPRKLTWNDAGWKKCAA